MAELNASTLAKRACMLGLLTDGQVQECTGDVDFAPGDAAALVRILERKGYLTSWQGQKLLKGDKDGFFVGGYRVLYKISSGSFGRVYRATDIRSGRVVAIKVLRQRWSENPKSVELFEREGKVGLALKHPNIVEILAVDRDATAKQHYLVMEFVEGGNLKDFLAVRKKLEPKEALRLIENAASGLAYAYGKGLTHRDLKTSNMLISSQGAIKLVDFGLAGMLTLGGREDDGKVERTVDYAGLEKATNVRPGDVRSDIYFLGCVLYEMLAGRPPLTVTKDKNARMQRQRFDNVVPITPEEVNGQGAVLRLVQTMMALEPLSRYQTPTQLVEAIREVRGEPDGRPAAERKAVAVNRVVFVVEPNLKLQDTIRNKFKEMGYRVLLSAEPARALMRFQQQPFDALIIDAGSAGEDGLSGFRQIMQASDSRMAPCAGVLILNEEQADWADRVEQYPRMAVLVRPVTLKQLHQVVNDLVEGTQTQE
jgi:serine/threonine protein kinase